MSKDEAQKIFDNSELEHSFDQDANRLLAIERDVKSGAFTKEGIQLIVNFDNEGKVTSIEEKRVFTGP